MKLVIESFMDLFRVIRRTLHSGDETSFATFLPSQLSGPDLVGGKRRLFHLSWSHTMIVSSAKR